MARKRTIRLTEVEYRALCGILGWAEAAGDATEWHDAATPQEKAALERLYARFLLSGLGVT